MIDAIQSIGVLGLIATVIGQMILIEQFRKRIEKLEKSHEQNHRH